MAGTLTVTWNNSSPIGGPFRIAYKYPAWNGNPASTGYPVSYVIINGIGCATPSCSYNINLPIITDEACDPLTIEGYVQPMCEAEFSLDGRIPFTVTFTPNAPCEAILFTCNDPVDGCDPAAFGTGCHGNIGVITAKAHNEDFSLCYDGGITGGDFLAVQAGIITAGYNIAEDPSICCYECIELTVTFDETAGSSPRVQYEKCVPTDTVIGNLNFSVGVPAPPVTVCARPNSWATDYPTAITFTTGAACT